MEVRCAIKFPQESNTTLDSLVRRSLALVIDRHLQATAGRYGAPPLGAHLERYIVDAMRRLSSRHSSWVPNRERSRTWYAPDGLFLVWPQSAADVLALLDADQLPGIPKAPEPVLDLLLAAGVLASRDDGHATWTILPPGAKAPLQAVKLSSPEILLAGLDPGPQVLTKPIVCRAVATNPPDSATPESAQAPPGTQYSLLEPTVAEDGTPASPTVPPPPAYSLNAPLRLNPAVRDALAAIVHTLNGPGTEAAARTVAAGLFVPLQAFEQRGIQPALAIRALADLRMLALPGRGQPPTVSHDFGGQAALGLVIAPQFVQGFDLAAFAPGATPEP
ncbi:MAG TPA: TraI domain-containing protein [Rubrivivax sp.]|nr:TraI domain-containing protein [Rubrivivax sp.]